MSTCESFMFLTNVTRILRAWILTSLIDIGTIPHVTGAVGAIAPNPCGSNNGGCSHLCLLSPKPPYYSCACPIGVLLKPDNRTCKDGPEHILLLARRPDLRVISLDTPDFSNVVLPVKHIASYVAIDYDPVDDMVYWSSNGAQGRAADWSDSVTQGKAIFRAKLNGEMEQEIISSDVEQCDGIAVDWVARNIYWSEADRHYIAVARLNGTSKKVIIEEGIVSPRAIVLDPFKGQLYWSDWGKPKIERASLDGSDRYVFVNSSILWPNGLAIDYKRELLFWAEAYLDKIEVIGLNGSNRRVLLEEKIPHIFGFSFLDDYLYWADWEKRKVERMLFYDRKSRHSIIEELPDLMGIKATDVNPILAKNPCTENNGGCSHLCLYTPKGVKCHCPDGQELLSDMKSCIEPEAFLLFTLLADGVHRISLETAPSASVEVPLEPGIDATSLDALVETETVFWISSDLKAIYRANMNGTNVTKIVSNGVGNLEDIAVDWIAHNIYWSDSERNSIEMAKLDGSSRTPIILQGIYSPYSLAVDPTNGYIYWSEWGRQPRICRARMDGSDVKELFGNGLVGRPTSLVIDFDYARLYWVDLDASEIASSSMVGTDRKQIFADEDNKFFSIALYRDYIFWNKGTVIERANKTDGSDRIRIQGHLPGPIISDMLVYHTSRQTGVSACSYNNGGCQYLCLTQPGGISKCACPAQYKLKKDNITCNAPDDFLLFVKEDEIKRIAFQHGQSSPQLPDAVLPFSGLNDVLSIAYDPFENYIIWIDHDGIRRSRMNGTKSQTLFHGNASHVSPHDLAVDHFNRMLYWTDSKKNSISALNLNGKLIGDIIIDSVQLVSDARIMKKSMDVRPRQIAVCPKKAQIFFSSSCEDSVSCRESILRSFVDGNDAMKLFSVKLKRITSLVVDQDRDRLYWSDDGMDTIESSNLEGRNRQIFQSGSEDPYGLTVYGSYIYWISKEEDSDITLWQIEAARKSESQKGRRKVKTLTSEVKDLVGVTNVNRQNQDYYADHYRTYMCAQDNGGCSHICVGKDDGTMTCSCPLHLSMINELECGEAPTCHSKQFECDSNIIPCIPEAWRCDGDDDCADNSDERHCPPCQLKNSFQCGTGTGGTAAGTTRSSDVGRFMEVIQNMKFSQQQCINMKQRCDGHPDCLDGSDEINCPCGEHQFQCDNGMCVSLRLKCNEHDDCGDSSDEECDEQSDQDNHSDKTMIIIIICCVLCVAIVIVVAAVTLRKKKARNGVTVGGVYTKRGGGRFHFNFKFTHGDGHGESENPNPRSSDFGSGGHSTASVNVSLTAGRSGQLVSSEIPQSCDRNQTVPSPHQYYDSIPYAGAVPSISHLPRPNIPGASSSTSSGRGRKHFQPTLNPPPSPATDRSGSKTAGDGHYSTDSQSTRAPPCHKCRGGHRPRRMHRSHAYVPVPHPTPCPSDSYDDCVSYSGTSVREFDSISWRSKSAGAPSSPPPPYCYCCHHMYHPTFVGCNGSCHPYPPSSCHTSRHGYRTPTMPHDPHHHSSSSSGSTHFGQPDCPVMCCNRSSGRYHYMPSRKPMCSAVPQRPPPCYNYEANSDSDPFAPPPTPRSQYLSDYCCTHDEAEENHDEEAYFDVMGKECSDSTSQSVASQNDSSDSKNTSQVKLASADNSDDDKAEDQPLLLNDDSPTNSAEIDFPILNPPPSPVAELS